MKFSDAETPAVTPDLDAIIGQAERQLRERLLAAGPLCALEADEIVGDFRRTLAALRLAATERPQAGLPPDAPLRFLEQQAAKEANRLAEFAEARAARTLDASRGLWAAWCDAQRRAARWTPAEA